MLIICFRMEELVTLQFGSFTILGKWAKEYAQRTGCSNQVCWSDPPGSALPENNKMRTPGLEYCLKTKVGSLYAGAPAPQCSLHEEKGAAKVLLSTTTWDCWSDGPWAHLCLGPFRVPRCGDTEDCQENLWRECVTAPSVLPQWWQEECIKELCLELDWHMARAGLQSRSRSARPTSWSRGCSHIWAQSPSAEPQEAEAAKHPREDPSTRQSRRWCSHSRSWNNSQRHGSPLPQSPSRCQSPSPSPPWSGPADEQLSCSLRDLHLCTRPWKSQSRAWRGDAPTHTKQCPPEEPMVECTSKDWRRSRSGLRSEKIWAVILPCPQNWPPS